MRRAVFEENRQILRERALTRRRVIAPTDAVLWSGAIQSSVLQLLEYRNAGAVALYSSVQNEVDTSVILSDALGSAKKVYFPKLSLVAGSGFARITSSDELIQGPYNILEPVGMEILGRSESDDLIVFLPGLLFDRRGNRLGRGGGWYDRALHDLGGRGVFVGLAYDFQLMDTLPAESWDQRVHIIVTEKGRIHCATVSHGIGPNGFSI